jgi:hypothetical protein
MYLGKNSKGSWFCAVWSDLKDAERFYCQFYCPQYPKLPICRQIEVTMRSQTRVASAWVEHNTKQNSSILFVQNGYVVSEVKNAVSIAWYKVNDVKFWNAVKREISSSICDHFTLFRSELCKKEWERERENEIQCCSIDQCLTYVWIRSIEFGNFWTPSREKLSLLYTV